MNLKKITAIMIGAVMAVSMAVPAMADDMVSLQLQQARTSHHMNSIQSTKMATRHFPDLIWIWLSTSQTRWDWNWK